jgi:hypothetical protein
MKQTLLIATWMILSMSLFSQTQFQMRYGSSYYDEAHKVIQTGDGNYLIVGKTNGFGSAGNAFIMKVSSTGCLLWLKDFAGINTDAIYDVAELSDKSLVMCGFTNSYGGGSSDGLIMKTDSAGNVIWTKAYGGTGGEYFCRISKDSTDGFYVALVFSNTSPSVSGSAIMRLDASGSVLWMKYVSDYNSYVDMLPLAEGGLYWPSTYIRIPSSPYISSIIQVP